VIAATIADVLSRFDVIADKRVPMAKFWSYF